MRKLFLSLVAFASFLVAADEYGLMQSLLDRQTSLAVAINSYIEDRGSVPPSITVLKNANYLPLAYDEKNPFDKDALTFTVANYQIRIDSNVESATRKADQVLYYINSINNRDLDRRSAQEGGKLISYYALSAKAATNLNLSTYLSYATFKGDIEPSLYQSVTAGAFWFSSTYEDMYQVKLFDGSSWGGLEKSNKNFNSIDGTFVNLNTLPLLKSSWKFTNVDINTIQKSIKCFVSGTTYNALKDRCEAYTSDACDGLIYRTSTGYCDIGDSSACAWNGGTWDKTLKTCKKGGSYEATATSGGSLVFSGFVGYLAGVPTDTLPIKVEFKGGLTYINVTNTWNGSFYTNFVRCDGDGSAEYAQYYPSSGLFTNTSVCSQKVRVTYESITYTCPLGGTLNGRTCNTVEYFSPGGCATGLGHDGDGRCAKTPTCTAKTMPIAPYYTTPHYGNNGVCYSDAGLYCSTYGVPMDGLYTCFNTNFGCDDSSYNLRTDTDVCEKFNYSCSTGKRYGLPESPTNNDATDLYNRITNKDDKMTAIVSTITKNDYNTNDNNGAMCAAVQFTTLSQPIYSPDYVIGGEVKSGF